MSEVPLYRHRVQQNGTVKVLAASFKSFRSRGSFILRLSGCLKSDVKSSTKILSFQRSLKMVRFLHWMVSESSRLLAAAIASCRASSRTGELNAIRKH